MLYPIIVYSLLLLILIVFFSYLKGYEYPFKINCDIKNIGESHIRDSSIIFCGLIKNGSYNIESIKKTIYSIVGICKTYKILIVENDSVDNTRQLLLEWVKKDRNVIVLGCGVNSEKCNIESIKNNNLKGKEKDRIDKMVYLRNIYMKYISKNLRDYDYTIVYDCDLVGKLYMDGVYHSFYNLKNYDINAVSAYGFINDSKNKMLSFLFDKLHIYDSYAFLKYNPSKTDYIDSISKLYYIDSISKYKKDKIIKVSSCFNGITIYRTESILDRLYKTIIIDDNVLCEHVPLNLEISKIYLSYLFVYNISKNN